jgi:Uma2 family endonuclease
MPCLPTDVVRRYALVNALHDLPVIKDQTTFNLDRWEELCSDPSMVGIEGKIETDRYGQVIMNLPAEPSHGGTQFAIGSLIEKRLPGGKIIVECPVSTSEGVKVPDLIWVSKERFTKINKRKAFSAAPEICVEVLSPSNTRNEIEEKRRLYFEAGASEVWVCEMDGRMRFFLKRAPTRSARVSSLCPKMPAKLEE